MRQPAPLLALVLLLALSPVGAAYAQQAAQAVDAAQQRKLEAEQAKTALRQRISEVQARLDKKSAQYKRASDALKQSEKAISDTTSRLRALGQEIAQGERTLSELQTQIDATQNRLQADREALAAQLRAQYRSNLSPWSAVLSGQDPQTLGRELGYLSFVSGARVQIIDSLRQGVAELSELQSAQTQQDRKSVV